MLFIRDPSSVPMGTGWQYPHPTSGFITSFNYSLHFSKVRETYQANGTTAPSDQDVINWMCANLYIECIEGDTRVPLINKWTQGISPRPTGCCGKYKMTLPSQLESV